MKFIKWLLSLIGIEINSSKSDDISRLNQVSGKLDKCMANLQKYYQDRFDLVVNMRIEYSKYTKELDKYARQIESNERNIKDLIKKGVPESIVKSHIQGLVPIKSVYDNMNKQKISIENRLNQETESLKSLKDQIGLVKCKKSYLTMQSDMLKSMASSMLFSKSYGGSGAVAIESFKEVEDLISSIDARLNATYDVYDAVGGSTGEDNILSDYNTSNISEDTDTLYKQYCKDVYVGTNSTSILNIKSV